MKRLSGLNVEGPEGMAENPGIRFARAGIRRSNDSVENEPVPPQYPVQAKIEIRNDREAESGIAGGGEDFRHLREDPPRGGIRIAGEEIEKTALHQPGVERAPCSVAEGFLHQPPPPLLLGAVALGKDIPFGIAGCWEEAGKGGFDPPGFQMQAVGGGVAGIDLRHRFGGFDQGPGGVEKEGADHH